MEKILKLNWEIINNIEKDAENNDEFIWEMYSPNIYQNTKQHGTYAQIYVN